MSWRTNYVRTESDYTNAPADMPQCEGEEETWEADQEVNRRSFYSSRVTEGCDEYEEVGIDCPVRPIVTPAN